MSMNFLVVSMTQMGQSYAPTLGSCRTLGLPYFVVDAYNAKP